VSAAIEGQRSAGGGGRLIDAALRWREASILIVAVALIIYFQAVNANFLTGANLRTLSQFIAVPAIIACGEVMLLICGEIDLSAGMMFALAPFVMYFANGAGMPILPALLLGVLAGALVGLVNGLITVRLRVPSFVTTLGTLFLLNGFTLTISHGSPVVTPGSEDFAAVMGAWDYSQFLWALLIVAIMHVVLRHTRWGLHTIATGGNPVGASEAGIRTGWIKIGTFVLTGALAAFAGLLESFRLGSSDPLAGGNNIMFMAVAAGVIGGTPLAGGAGTIIGALLGAIVLGVLQDGFNLQGINAFTFNMILGGAILLAMIGNVHLPSLRRSR
jgi:simple sugar transport system permease protein